MLLGSVISNSRKGLQHWNKGRKKRKLTIMYRMIVFFWNKKTTNEDAKICSDNTQVDKEPHYTWITRCSGRGAELRKRRMIWADAGVLLIETGVDVQRSDRNCRMNESELAGSGSSEWKRGPRGVRGPSLWRRCRVDWLRKKSPTSDVESLMRNCRLLWDTWTTACCGGRWSGRDAESCECLRFGDGKSWMLCDDTCLWSFKTSKLSVRILPRLGLFPDWNNRGG